MHNPDEWLMRHVAEGHSRDLEQLVRRHAGPLLTLIHRLVGTRHNADEIFQDVFVAVWTKRATYRFPAPFRPWLYAIAVNRCRQLLRRRGRPVLSLFADPAGGDEPPPSLADTRAQAPPDTAVATETAALVEAAVQRLPERQRAVVVLRIYSGLPYCDIAATLHTRETTVRGTMHDALANLRRYLEPRLRDHP